MMAEIFNNLDRQAEARFISSLEDRNRESAEKRTASSTQPAVTTFSSSAGESRKRNELPLILSFIYELPSSKTP